MLRRIRYVLTCAALMSVPASAFLAKWPDAACLDCRIVMQMLLLNTTIDLREGHAAGRAA